MINTFSSEKYKKIPDRKSEKSKQVNGILNLRWAKNRKERGKRDRGEEFLVKQTKMDVNEKKYQYLFFVYSCLVFYCKFNFGKIKHTLWS